jgi:hypothetical protein
MKRLSNGRYLKEWQLGPYMEHYCSRRLSPTLDDFHPIEYKDKPHEPIPRLPFFDEVAGCMSSSVDWGHHGNLTVAYVMEYLQMFGGLNMGKYQ